MTWMVASIESVWPDSVGGTAAELTGKGKAAGDRSANGTTACDSGWTSKEYGTNCRLFVLSI